MLDVRRVAARHVAVEVGQGTLDFGILTFQPPERGLQALTIGADEMVLLVHPGHPLAGRAKVTLAEFGQQTVVAHSDPSPARERVLRVSEVRHAPINIQIALPSLEAIKRAVELQMGVALLPRRCALTEIARGISWRFACQKCDCRGRCGWSTGGAESCRMRPARFSRWSVKLPDRPTRSSRPRSEVHLPSANRAFRKLSWRCEIEARVSTGGEESNQRPNWRFVTPMMTAGGEETKSALSPGFSQEAKRSRAKVPKLLISYAPVQRD